MRIYINALLRNLKTISLLLTCALGPLVGFSHAQTAGDIYTVAGEGVANEGYNGDQCPATSAWIKEPEGIAVDSQGNVYFSDSINWRIRRVDHATNCITTVAGNGTYGSGSGQIGTPYGLALKNDTTLFISDIDFSRVLALDIPSGTFTTIATPTQPQGLAMNGQDKLEIAAPQDQVIYELNLTTNALTIAAGIGAAGYSGDGGLAVNAAINNAPGVAVFNGDIFIADNENSVIRKVDHATGNISTVAGVHLQTDSSGDGGPATSAHIGYPMHISFDAGGNMYFSDYRNCVIREVNFQSQIIQTIAGVASVGCSHSGDSIPATSADLSFPTYMAIYTSGVTATSSNNTLYFSESGGNYVRRIYQTYSGPPAALVISPSPVSFTTNPGATSAAQTITVKNQTGNALSDLAITDNDTTHFLITSSTCSSTLANNASCTFNLACYSTGTGAPSSTIVAIGGGFSATLPMTCSSVIYATTYSACGSVVSPSVNFNGPDGFNGGESDGDSLSINRSAPKTVQCTWGFAPQILPYATTLHFSGLITFGGGTGNSGSFSAGIGTPTQLFSGDTGTVRNFTVLIPAGTDLSAVSVHAQASSGASTSHEIAETFIDVFGIYIQ